MRGMAASLVLAVLVQGALAQVDSRPAGVPVEAVRPVVPVRESPVSAPVIQPVGPGQVDWTYHIVRATGMSVLDTSLPVGQRKAMAIRGARVDAQRNLLETVKGVRVVSETKVNDLMMRSDYVFSKVDGVIKGAVQVGEPRETGDGRVEVTMEVPVYGPSGLAGPLVDEVLKSRPPRLPATALSPQDQDMVRASSGVVFDISGGGIEPQMFPALLDSSGNVLLDMIRYYQSAGPDAFKRFQYIQSIEDVLGNPDLRANPTVIKIVKAVKDGWVVAQKDIKKVSWLQRALDVLLKAGKLIALFLR